MLNQNNIELMLYKFESIENENNQIWKKIQLNNKIIKAIYNKKRKW